MCRVLVLSALVVLVVCVPSCSGVKNSSDDVPTETEATMNDDGLSVLIASGRYYKHRKVLVLDVLLRNDSAERIIVVVSDYLAFVDVGPQILKVEEIDNSIVFDLSYNSPFPDKSTSFQRYGYRVPTEYFAINANAYRNVRCVFALPLSLDYRFSRRRVFEEPNGKKNVSVRFGYALESLDEFERRNPSGKRESILSRTQQLATQWQNTADSNAVTIDFEAGGVSEK